MRRRLVRPVLLVLFGALQAAPLAAQQRVVVFTNVGVIPMDRERVLEEQTVVVRGDRIAEIGPAASTAVPPGATRVDGHGKYLIPGLAEMHAHVPVPRSSSSWARDTPSECCCCTSRAV